MRAEEIKGLIEAYSKVHETPEVLSEETEQLDEVSYAAGRELAGLRGLAGRLGPLAGVATWADTSDQERAAAQHLKRTGVRPGELYRPTDVDAQGRPKPGAKPQLNRLTGGAKPTQQVQNQIAKNEKDRRNMNPGDYFEKPKPSPDPGSNRPGPGGTPSGSPGGSPSNVISAKNIAGQSQKVTVNRKYGATLGGQKGSVTYDAAGKRTFTADKPSTAVEKPTDTPASDKPSPSSTPTAKPSAMDQWRKANPKLAAAADEKARIRGTSQTDNPLMKDMRSKMSMTPSVQSPTLAKDLGTGSGNQSLLNNPNASKAAPPNPAATAAPKPTAAAKPSGFDLAKKGVNLAGINNTNPQQKKPVTNSYEWPSAKTIRDIADAYSSIYEAKKKIDQDQDGDNDFADVRVARMVASGVPKEVAIAKVKGKPYNEDFELWVNELLEEGYDLSDYTWDEVAEIYLDEATAMAKRGYDEAPIRQKIAKSTGGGESADRATALENRPTYGDANKTQQRQRYAREQRGDFRKTTSSNPGLHGYAHKSDDPAVKAKQAARGAQRGVLTPRERKQLNREAYEAYELVASYLLENNFASTVNDANVIINNMSENWFESIMEDVRGVSYNPNPIGNAIRAGAGLLKNTMNRPSVQGAIKTGSQMLQKSVPSGGYSTREGDGKPRETPLWDGPSKPTPTTPTKPQTKKQPPMRDEPLW